MMNEIPNLQNSEPQLQMLRSREQVRKALGKLSLAQLIVTTLIPIMGAVAAARKPQFRPEVAAVALLITIIDLWVLDREQKTRSLRQAKLAEQFDCTVLSLPWDQFVAGGPVSPEEVHTTAQEYLARPNSKVLLNWYPAVVGDVPLHIARLICQRANLRYDSGLRRRFATILRFGPLCFATVLVVWGLGKGETLTDWVLTLAPLSPILAWSIREFYRQSDAAQTSDDLMQATAALWDAAVEARVDPVECALRSRELQSAIYRRRAGTPPVPGFIYHSRRAPMEEEMNEGAKHLVQEYRDATRVP